MRTLCACPLQELDDWFNAKILSRKEVPVPHTALMMKVFTVRYEAPKNGAMDITEDAERSVGDEAEQTLVDKVVEMEVRVENDVTSDRIRLLSSSTGVVQLENQAIQINTVDVMPSAASYIAPAAASSVIDESTGTCSYTSAGR
jgi:hypothetical protein